MFEHIENMRVAEVVVIGNEVTSGLIGETNSRVLSLRLNAEGLDVQRITMVGDDPATMREALEAALARADVVVATGGLGPTHDDITKNTLAEMFGSTLLRDPKVVEMIEEFFRRRGRSMPAYALVQADVPDKAEALYNEKGSAPGLLFRRDGKMLFALPGVPLEMEHLLEKYIVPAIAPLGGNKIGHRRLLTTGITESALWTRIGSMEPIANEVVVASLPSHLGVTLRLSAAGRDPEDIRARLDRAEAFFRQRAGSLIYGMDDDTLESVVGNLLTQKGFKVATAESCTGGLIGSRITNVSGSSAYFQEGFVTYSNAAKISRLGVDPKLIEKYGAVSHEVAVAMAEGVRAATGADVALAVTGIAGPTGGTPTKPVGLTYIALSAKWACECEMFVFPQDRVRNKERAAQAALNLLRLWLIGEKGLIE